MRHPTWAPETLLWRAVSHELPDADEIVLVYAPKAEEPVWLGWYDGVYWFAVDGSDYSTAAVEAWAPMPGGPPR